MIIIVVIMMMIITIINNRKNKYNTTTTTTANNNNQRIHTRTGLQAQYGEDIIKSVPLPWIHEHHPSLYDIRQVIHGRSETHGGSYYDLAQIGRRDDSGVIFARIRGCVFVGQVPGDNVAMQWWPLMRGRATLLASYAFPAWKWFMIPGTKNKFVNTVVAIIA